MRIVLYTDNTLPLPIAPLCNLLNSICKGIEFSAGTERLRIEVPQILFESIYMSLPNRLRQEAKEYDFAIMATSVPYENNYFFEATDNLMLVSFSSWNLYTDLPVTNGFVYFIATILISLLDMDEMHYQNTGCISDFLQDKTGVDVGMRAAFICGKCRDRYTGEPELLQDVENILNLLSTASRSNKDILSIEPVGVDSGETTFDVFLCHNSEDKPEVRKVNEALQAAGIVTWLDEEQLGPGILWQVELENQISKVKSACVFVGANGRGPWQDMEIRSFLIEFVNRGSVVIPVILPSAPEIPNLPIFLKQMAWVDLRRDYDNEILKLVAALRRK